MRTITIPEAQNVVLDGEPWSFYSRLLHHFDGHRRLFITYYRGYLEITTRTFWRERAAVIMGLLVCVWTEERGLEIHGGRSTRFRRRDLRCGLEPDQCFWLAHEKQVRGLKELVPLKGLQTLNLHDTRVTDAGVAELQKALPDCKIIR